MQYARTISKFFVLFALLALFFSIFHVAHADTATVTVEIVVRECSDGLDNDFDGLTDFPNDPGCTSGLDDDETDPQCTDGLDNDGDGLIDFPDDPGCTDADDNDETDPPAEEEEEEEEEAGGISGGSVGVPSLGPVASVVVFTGLAHPDSEVVLLQDGIRVAVTTAGSDGSFSFELRNVTVGSYNFSLYGTDTDGVRSGLLSFTVDIVSSFRMDISNIFIPPTIQLLREGDTTAEVSGRTVPSARVEVAGFREGDEIVRTVVSADSDGRYRATLSDPALSLRNVAIKSFAAAGALNSPFGRAAGFAGISAGRPALQGDFNSDGRVNLIDFSMAAYWFERLSPPRQFDLDGNGAVDLVDFSIIVFNWTG